jgi:polyphenol oxidase
MKKHNDIKLYQFGHFKKNPYIVHGIFARTGGISQKPFDSLNIGINSGDKKSDIAENRRLIINKLGNKPFIFLNQIHEDGIKIIKKEDITRVLAPENNSFTADAAITDIKNIFLLIQVADCQAVMLYDQQKKVIANIHSGWRGSVLNIIGNTVEKMISEFGCKAENIIAGISPSLGPCCAEFINFITEIPERLWQYKIKNTNYFNFWALSRDQLLEKGVLHDNIQNMEICTKCNTHTFYSYRKEKTTGRFASVISIQEDVICEL